MPGPGGATLGALLHAHGGELVLQAVPTGGQAAHHQDEADKEEDKLGVEVKCVLSFLLAP